MHGYSSGKLAAIDVAYRGVNRILLVMTLNVPFKLRSRSICRRWGPCVAYLGAILIGTALLSNIVWADSSDFFKPQHVTGASSTGEGAEEAVATPVKKKKSSYSFAKYKRMIADVCKGLDADGRQLKFFEMLDEHDVRDVECPACKPLISSFTGSCRAAKPSKKVVVKKAKHKKGSEPEEVADPEPEISPTEGEEGADPALSKVFLQREPNVLVIQGLSQIFSPLAEDEEWIDEHAKAVDRLVKILREKEGKTLAEIDYFDFMSQYIMAPFTEYFEKKMPKGRQKGRSGEKKAPAQSVDSLFE